MSGNNNMNKNRLISKIEFLYRKTHSYEEWKRFEFDLWNKTMEELYLIYTELVIKD